MQHSSMIQAHRRLLSTPPFMEAVSFVHCRGVNISAGRQWISPHEETCYKMPVVFGVALSVMMIDSCGEDVALYMRRFAAAGL